MTANATCVDLVRFANPTDHEIVPFLVPVTDRLKEAMKEAITMAESALNVMNEHAGDQHVSDMLKLVLGEGTEYQSKFDAVKSEHEGFHSMASHGFNRYRSQEPSRML
jgi:hypothetical protein